MAPSWAVNRQPLWVANASAAAIGASSRVLTSEEMMPTAGPRPSSCKEIVTLDADHDAHDHAQDQRHTGGAATDHQRAVAPGHVGQQPGVLLAVALQHDQDAGDGSSPNTRMSELHDRVGDLGASCWNCRTTGWRTGGVGLAVATIELQPRLREEDEVQLADRDVDDHQQQDRLDDRGVDRVGHPADPPRVDRPFWQATIATIAP